MDIAVVGWISTRDPAESSYYNGYALCFLCGACEPNMILNSISVQLDQGNPLVWPHRARLTAVYELGPLLDGSVECLLASFKDLAASAKFV